MIERNLASRILESAGSWPVVTITGPRQSGKTTLCRAVFPDHSYVSLEDPAARDFAARDGRGFLNGLGDRAVIDEVQRVPELLSWIQVEVDEHREMGRYVLTGSTNFGLLRTISQSLAGRTAVINLFPCSHDELQRFPGPPADPFEAMYLGGYPALYDRDVTPAEWFASYVSTYVERDVREIVNVGDLSAFEAFLRLAAGWTGQLLNLSRIGSDVGVSSVTIKSWLSILSTGYIADRLRPYHRNLGKREVRTPKLYFLDSGLACWLMGIRSPDELRHHPQRGAIFETWVLGEIRRALTLDPASPLLHFYRERSGLEIDFLIEHGIDLAAIEVKSSETIGSHVFRGLNRLERRFEAAGGPGELSKFLVYAGAEGQRRTAATVVPWTEVATTEWR